MSGERVRELVQLTESRTEGVGRVVLLCALLAESVPVSGVGLSVTGGSGRQTKVAATDDVSDHVEDLQVLLGQGPCIDAMSKGRPVLVPDLGEPAVSARWPAFAPAAAAIGVRATFAVPLLAGDVRLGSIDLYRDAVGDLGSPQLAEVETYAHAAVEVLLSLQHGQRDGGLADGLVPGWAGSSTVHQATGMVMVQLGTDAAGAFAALRARAYGDDRPLQDVARDVLDRRLRLDGGQ